MTGITSYGEKRLVVVSGRAHPALAAEGDAELRIKLVRTTAYDYANEEIYVRFDEIGRGADVFVQQSHTSPINQWNREHHIMVDALKRASAKEITTVIRFYRY